MDCLKSGSFLEDDDGGGGTKGVFRLESDILKAISGDGFGSKYIKLTRI